MQTTHRIHVKGQLYGPLAEEFSHVYDIPVTSKSVPMSKEVARSVAAVDFSRISEMHVEEITIHKRLLKFEDEEQVWAEPCEIIGTNEKGIDNDDADE